MNNISEIRQEYTKFSLDITDVSSTPFIQFKEWFETAIKSELFYDPTSFILSTCGKDMIPTSRVLLLKGFDENGFQFFTNYSSKKGKNLSENPNASMLFFWDKLERQVRISGIISRLNDSESEKYFNSRPYESRIGAIASEQSSELNSKVDLENKIKELKIKYPSNPPRPINWGGYNLVPNSFEFWQGRESRLHDRIIYTLNEGNWIINRLYP
ncbi:MAG: pyridoxamine 5'-phosphate oxidase [Candidatus Kapaibacterium sp.]|nr:pyridoxamine 5'-phosphate oxidase [Ignavibacteriota bacterium]